MVPERSWLTKEHSRSLPAPAGIGFELPKLCAKHGYDILVTGDEKESHDASF
jgi:hypothetical protein